MNTDESITDAERNDVPEWVWKLSEAIVLGNQGYGNAAVLIHRALTAQLTEARESERAAVVAFCRSERAPFAMSYFPEDGKPYERQFYGGEFADAIERGDHLT